MTRKNRKKYAVIGGAAAAAVAIAAVVVAVSFSLRSPSGPSLTTASGNGDSVQGLQVGNSAPSFSLTDPQKGGVTKQTFAGKPLFIFFTVASCSPCQIGAQNLAKYYDQMGGNKAFNVLIVDVDGQEQTSQIVDFKNTFGRSDWYVASGPNMAAAYNVQYLDTKIVFDKNGIIRWIDLNPLQYSTAKQVLDPLVAQ